MLAVFVIGILRRLKRVVVYPILSCLQPQDVGSAAFVGEKINHNKINKIASK